MLSTSKTKHLINSLDKCCLISKSSTVNVDQTTHKEYIRKNIQLYKVGGNITGEDFEELCRFADSERMTISIGVDGVVPNSYIFKKIFNKKK
jgi:hypothetical protein